MAGALLPPRLTLITDSSRYTDEVFFDALQQALDAGLDAVLVREKTLTSAKLLALASRLRQLTRAAGARLLIHTQADIADAVDADGVHLAAADMASVAAVRQWLEDPAKSVSVSCHHAQELTAAEQSGADYCFLSPLFPTATHPGAAHLGLERFQQLAVTARMPVVALGGIHADNCSLLSGWPLAVLGAIPEADDPAAVTRTLLAVAGGKQ